MNECLTDDLDLDLDRGPYPILSLPRFNAIPKIISLTLILLVKTLKQVDQIGNVE